MNCPDRFPTLVVTAGLIEKDKRLLITQRKKGDHQELLWEFPGGKLEENEDPRECLKREITEELGIEVQVTDILETVFYHYPKKNVLLLFYRCSYLSGQPRCLDCHDLSWITLEELSNYAFVEADIQFIKEIDKYLK